VAAQVDDGAALGRDPGEGPVQLGPAVTTQGAEGIAGEAEAGSSLAVASLDGRTVARPGEPLALGLDGARALLFDAVSGRLL